MDYLHVQAEKKHCIPILYHLPQQLSVDLAHHETFRAKVGKGGISTKMYCSSSYMYKYILIRVKNGFE